MAGEARRRMMESDPARQEPADVCPKIGIYNYLYRHIPSGPNIRARQREAGGVRTQRRDSEGFPLAPPPGEGPQRGAKGEGGRRRKGDLEVVVLVSYRYRSWDKHLLLLGALSHYPSSSLRALSTTGSTLPNPGFIPALSMPATPISHPTPFPYPPLVLPHCSVPSLWGGRGRGGGRSVALGE